MAGFAGLDSSGYPGDEALYWLKQNTNLKWSGFYLGPTPSHSGTSWMDRRARLAADGWGLAPIYVGQQTVGPGSHHSNAHQGYKDGTDAAQLMKQAGFTMGTCVYLDLKNGPPSPPEQLAYVRAWVDKIEHEGFAAGVYCSYKIAVDIHQIVPTALIWVFHVSATAPHPVPGPNYPDNHPGGSGYAGAFIWQLGQNCRIYVPNSPNHTITVDLNTAAVEDPGVVMVPAGEEAGNLAHLHIEEHADDFTFQEDEIQHADEAANVLAAAAPKPVPSDNPFQFALSNTAPSKLFWPVKTKHPSRFTISYTTSNGKVIGSASRQFLARRQNGKRYHLAIDLYAYENDEVIACETGKIVNFYEFYQARSGEMTHALLVEHADFVVNYGEVKGNASELYNWNVGDRVKAGQPIARVSATGMTHFETYKKGVTRNERWMVGGARPRNLTAYVLEIASA